MKNYVNLPLYYCPNLPIYYEALENSSKELKNKYNFMREFLINSYMHGYDLGKGSRIKVFQALQKECKKIFIEYYIQEQIDEQNRLWNLIL